MTEQDPVFDFRFSLTNELTDAANRHYDAGKGLLSLLWRGYWYILPALFFTCWGILTLLAKQGIYPSESLGVALKASAAGFAAATFPTLFLFWAQSRRQKAFLGEGVASRVRFDEQGCHTEVGDIQSFVPWKNFEEILETDFGLVLRYAPFRDLIAVPFKPNTPAMRRSVMNRLEEWRDQAT